MKIRYGRLGTSNKTHMPLFSVNKVSAKERALGFLKRIKDPNRQILFRSSCISPFETCLVRWIISTEATTGLPSRSGPQTYRDIRLYNREEVTNGKIGMKAPSMLLKPPSI